MLVKNCGLVVCRAIDAGAIDGDCPGSRDDLYIYVKTLTREHLPMYAGTPRLRQERAPIRCRHGVGYQCFVIGSGASVRRDSRRLGYRCDVSHVSVRHGGEF